jgi:hypothetical protein
MLQSDIEILEKLKSVFTVEQLKAIAETCVATRNRAENRRCNQTVEIIFNDKGFPRFVKSTDAFQFSPLGSKMYVPE